MYPPAVWEGQVKDAVACAIRDFLLAHPNYVGRLMWWLEGESLSSGELWVQVCYPGGSSTRVHQAESGDARPIVAWLRSVLAEDCAHALPPVQWPEWLDRG